MAALQRRAADSTSLRAPLVPVFYYDLGNPECYLAAEQLMAELPVPAEWVPVLEPSDSRQESPDRSRFEQRAGERGLQPALQLGGRPGRQLPVEDHLAGLDRDHLQAVKAPPVRQERGLRAAPRDEQLICAVGPHAAPPSALAAC